MVSTSVRPDGISVVMRVHDPRRLPLLDEALFSVAVQHVRPVQVVVAVQGAAVSPAAVRERLSRQPFALDDARSHSVVVEGTGVDADLRARLLNLGMAMARYRYLAFLDDDDVVYQSGYARLLERLRDSGAALAAGGTVRADFVHRDGRWIAERRFEWVHGGTALRDLIDRNFLPLHSFLIDRSRVGGEDLRFDETLTRLEDYDFLLRLGARYDFDLACLDVPVCEYRLRRGADHVNPLANANARGDPQWRAALDHIAALKRRLAPAYEVMPRPAPSAVSHHWWRAVHRSRLHVGGWAPLALRVLRDLRRHGVRQLFNEARRVARRQ
jgi:hypothetical protein